MEFNYLNSLDDVIIGFIQKLNPSLASELIQVPSTKPPSAQPPSAQLPSPQPPPPQPSTPESAPRAPLPHVPSQLPSTTPSVREARVRERPSEPPGTRIEKIQGEEGTTEFQTRIKFEECIQSKMILESTLESLEGQYREARESHTKEIHKCNSKQLLCATNLSLCDDTFAKEKIHWSVARSALESKIYDLQNLLNTEKGQHRLEIDKCQISISEEKEEWLKATSALQKTLETLEITRNEAKEAYEIETSRLKQELNEERKKFQETKIAQEFQIEILLKQQNQSIQERTELENQLEKSIQEQTELTNQLEKSKEGKKEVESQLEILVKQQKQTTKENIELENQLERLTEGTKELELKIETFRKEKNLFTSTFENFCKVLNISCPTLEFDTIIQISDDVRQRIQILSDIQNESCPATLTARDCNDEIKRKASEKEQKVLACLRLVLKSWEESVEEGVVVTIPEVLTTQVIAQKCRENKRKIAEIKTKVESCEHSITQFIQEFQPILGSDLLFENLPSKLHALLNQGLQCENIQTVLVLAIEYSFIALRIRDKLGKLKELQDQSPALILQPKYFFNFASKLGSHLSIVTRVKADVSKWKVAKVNFWQNVQEELLSMIENVKNIEGSLQNKFMEIKSLAQPITKNEINQLMAPSHILLEELSLLQTSYTFWEVCRRIGKQEKILQDMLSEKSDEELQALIHFFQNLFPAETECALTTFVFFIAALRLTNEISCELISSFLKNATQGELQTGLSKNLSYELVQSHNFLKILNHLISKETGLFQYYTLAERRVYSNDTSELTHEERDTILELTKPSQEIEKDIR